MKLVDVLKFCAWAIIVAHVMAHCERQAHAQCVGGSCARPATVAHPDVVLIRPIPIYRPTWVREIVPVQSAPVHGFHPVRFVGRVMTAPFRLLRGCQ